MSESRVIPNEIIRSLTEQEFNYLLKYFGQTHRVWIHKNVFYSFFADKRCCIIITDSAILYAPEHFRYVNQLSQDEVRSLVAFGTLL